MSLSTSAVNELGSPSCLTGTIAQKAMGYDGGAVGAYTNGQAGDGNISAKSDIGGYHYGQKGAGPHAVSSIDTSATGGCTLARCLVDGISSPYFYEACPPAALCADRGDADGNMLCVTNATSCDATAARSYAWTSFDMAETISTGANSAALAYTPEHARGSLTAGGATMYYLNNPAAGDMEELVAGATPVWHTYLSAYGHIPACAGTAELFTSGGATTTYYFVGDHLASTAALADAGGNQAEYDSGACPPAALRADRGDAWGLARNSGGSDYGTGCLTLHPQSKTLRRFTGQEAIDSYCLINLNARLYDPALGRMLSADPMVSDATNGQAYDKYSYVVNRPLSFTDPSGNVTCSICDQGYIDQDGGSDGGGGDGGDGFSYNFTTGSAFPCSEAFGCFSPVYDDPGILPFGGLGFGFGGFGGGGAARNIGCVGGCPATQLAANGSSDIPLLETVIVTGCCSDFLNGDFSWDQPWANQGFLGWDGVTGGEGNSTPGGQLAQLLNRTPQEGSRSLSMGMFVSTSSIPFTSGGGATSGINYQYVPGTDQQWYQFNGGGQGLNLGLSLQSSWAWGSGPWTGTFDSVNISAGVFAGSIYWTPGPGGWVGGSFGFSAGLPVDLSYETVNYSYFGNH